MYSSVNKRILALCVCCSCVAHAGLLLGISDRFKPSHITAGQALSVSLRQKTTHVAATRAQETDLNPDASEAIPSRRPSTGLRQHPVNDATVTMVTTKDTTGKAQPDRSPITHQAHFSSLPRVPAPATAPPEVSLQVRLRAMMSSYFSYPRLARQRNWQGEVRLGLRVEANGRLSHIHIVKSSGYTLLDHAAQNSLERIATIPDAADWLQGRHFDTVIPVEYHLVDS